MRVLLVAALLACVGCVSEETRDLAWGIEQYQRAQVTSVSGLVEQAVKAQLISEEDGTELVKEQKALADASRTLVEILGEPKTKPELPGIKVVTDE